MVWNEGRFCLRSWDGFAKIRGWQNERGWSRLKIGDAYAVEAIVYLFAATDRPNFALGQKTAVNYQLPNAAVPGNTETKYRSRSHAYSLPGMLYNSQHWASRALMLSIPPNVVRPPYRKSYLPTQPPANLLVMLHLLLKASLYLKTFRSLSMSLQAATYGRRRRSGFCYVL